MIKRLQRWLRKWMGVCELERRTAVIEHGWITALSFEQRIRILEGAKDPLQEGIIARLDGTDAACIGYEERLNNIDRMMAQVAQFRTEFARVAPILADIQKMAAKGQQGPVLRATTYSEFRRMTGEPEDYMAATENGA